jgi:hypothetical protein
MAPLRIFKDGLPAGFPRHRFLSVHKGLEPRPRVLRDGASRRLRMTIFLELLKPSSW